ncbi:MAG: hypothetical protein EPO51_08335 [Phenylobacterium sp.]|uniref:hypothetical protein n=1 Tax=Phenylobacterium sp. TaxID=1871053 RepID=UPI00121F70AA|nr:hypothetical protein [Phenylobacterium sp.]TAJ72116.1 MAG: hypothetical protein EPO51_08335 [Phenylobacterium sp.]
MAESQEIYPYSAESLERLTEGLTAARLARYMVSANGDRNRALQLYLWNARLSKAFLFPLQACEVFTRNAMHKAFSERWGQDWVFDPPFALNEHSKRSHVKALDQLARRKKGAAISPDDVVATLNFDFWSNLLRADYQEALWSDRSLFAKVFPNLPKDHGRGQVQFEVAAVNALRNRIAHHEPISAQDHGKALNRILDVIGLISRDYRDWTRAHCTVMGVAKSPPSIHSAVPGRPLAQANLRSPTMISSEASLLEALTSVASARPGLLLVRIPDAPGYAAVSAQSISGYLAKHIAAAQADTGGLIDLGDHTVEDVLTTVSLVLQEVDRRATTGDAMALFYPSQKGTARPDALLVVEDGVLHGLLTRPDARF